MFLFHSPENASRSVQVQYQLQVANVEHHNRSCGRHSATCKQHLCNQLTAPNHDLSVYVVTDDMGNVTQDLLLQYIENHELLTRTWSVHRSSYLKDH